MASRGSPAIAGFPRYIWDGASNSRIATADGPLRNLQREPDGDDWNQAVAEIQAVQTQSRISSRRLQVPVAAMANPLTVATRDPASSSNIRCDRQVFYLPRGCHSLQFMFGNYMGVTADNSAESANTVTITVKAAVEYPVSALLAAAGPIYPIYFGNSRTGTIPGGLFLNSDILQAPEFPGGVYIAVRTWVNIPSYSSGNTYGVGKIADPTILEGFSNGGDVVDSGVMAAGTASTALYGPVKVTGVLQEPWPTIWLVGDSIVAGSNELAQTSMAGFALRGLANKYPIVYSPRSGESLAGGGTATSGFTPAKRIKRTLVATGVSNVVLNYGINDLGSILAGTGTVADYKANVISTVNSLTRRGMKVFWCTLFPRTLSSDGYRTVANQTQVVEPNRQIVQAFLRDLTTTAGCKMSCERPELFDILDPTSYIEVNSSGVTTLNGGYWPAGTDRDTGTATAGSTTTLTDSTKTWTVSQWVNEQCIVLFLSGTGAGQRATITANTATQLTFATQAIAPSTDTVYVIVRANTLDGTHPTAICHSAAAPAMAMGQYAY